MLLYLVGERRVVFEVSIEVLMTEESKFLWLIRTLYEDDWRASQCRCSINRCSYYRYYTAAVPVEMGQPKNISLKTGHKAHSSKPSNHQFLVDEESSRG